MLRATFRIVYRWLRRFSEWHERHHIPIALFETIVAFAGAVLFVTELHWPRSVGDIFRREFIWGMAGETGLFEAVIFVLLALSIMARTASVVRGWDLGPSFGAFLDRVGRGAARRDPAVLRERLFANLTSLWRAHGLRGKVLSGSEYETKAAIEALARAAATTLSVRTYGEPDRWWERWEAAYMAQWFSSFPQSIWRVPPESNPQDATAGYFSVIVPIASHSYSSISYGHLHSALATLNVPGRRRSGRAESPSHVNLLIYTSLYVQPRDSRDKGNEDLIIYTPIEHLNFLVGENWPDLIRAEPKRGLRIICESSNKSLDTILEALGFHVLEQPSEAIERGRRVNQPVLSPARFKLFELSYHPAIDGSDDRNADGKAFLDLLRTIAGPRGTKAGDQARGAAVEG